MPTDSASLSPLLIVLLLALVLLVLGGVAVLLISRGGPKKAPSTPAPEVHQPLPDLDQLVLPMSLKDGPPSLLLTNGEAVEVQAVLLLLRDSRGKLIAQTSSRAYRWPSAAADSDPEFSYQISSLLRELSGVDVVVPPPAPVKSAPEPKAVPASAGLTPTPSHKGALPGDLPKFTSVEATEAPRLGRRPTTGPVPEINIAGSIETYLQYRLGNEAALAGRRVHVLPAGADGVRLEVDGQHYESIEDIPDLLVRDFLRQTISEWQQRQ